ncbi:MBL fold metallo-hydrolase [Teichococcus oryzae]|uniref:MBL fold metallo-hydrolase n=1 Tax=Teichococcus oryzae TaxID=1608942 RepID=A0A5B2TEJ2_9PROT|nr:MBL fold metallo-hydrolase [Pseudoroseomonas oryzae]KAA2212533.1 MBL fold metallo-hydrolase [Pseudoroseomonas oryzae]
MSSHPPHPASPEVAAFHDPRTGSVQYVVSDPATHRCAIIDPVLDFDPASGSIGTDSADALLRHIEMAGLSLQWILDTHPHADHFSAADYLRRRSGAATATGARTTEVRSLWRDLYNLPALGEEAPWSRLFEDGDCFQIGEMPVRVMLTPGHTLASVTFVAGDAAFVHDTLFMPDSGTARADFPGGDAAALWHSIGRILALPDSTRLFTGHDYCPNGRPPAWESRVAQQRAENIHLQAARDEAAFVRLRQERDRSLPIPRLMLAALQVNLCGGRLPPPEANGRRYLKLPLEAFPEAPWEAA